MQADLYINLLGYSYFQRDFWVNGAYFAPAKPLPLTQEYLWNIPAVHGAELPFSNAPAAVDRRRMQTDLEIIDKYHGLTCIEGQLYWYLSCFMALFSTTLFQDQNQAYEIFH